MTEELLADIKKWTEQAEGRIHWLYLDTGGLPTTGIGHQVFTFDEAVILPFSPAITKEGWNLLITSPFGQTHPASEYAKYTQGRLTDQAIDIVLDEDLRDCMDALQKKINLVSFPDPCQCAITDMGFNLGVAGFMKFSKLVAAANAGDWKTCADECHRKGISEVRNQWCADLFRKAV